VINKLFYCFTEVFLDSWYLLPFVGILGTRRSPSLLAAVQRFSRINGTRLCPMMSLFDSLLLCFASIGMLDLLLFCSVRGAECCDERVCLSALVCLCVCLSGLISETVHPISTSFVHAAYDSCSILLWQHCDTLCTLVLWMTSCLHIMARNRQCRKGVYSNWPTRGSTRPGMEFDSMIAFDLSVCVFKNELLCFCLLLI